MRKHAAFWGALIVVGLVLATLFGCDQGGKTYAKVCADTESNPVRRALDDECDAKSTSGRYAWRYYQPATMIPPVGGKLPTNQFYTKEPSDSETLVRISEDKGGTAYGSDG